MGLIALAYGAIAWDAPLPVGIRKGISFLDTESMSPGARHRWVWRLLGPVNGSVFVVAGLYIIWGTLSCRPLNLGIPNISGTIALSTWPGVVPAALVALGFGIYNARGMSAPALRVLYVLLTAFFGFACGQTAGFHTGLHATQWFVISLPALALSGFVWFLDRRLRGMG